MAAERFNLPPPEDPSASSGWNALRRPIPESLEGSDKPGKKEKEHNKAEKGRSGFDVAVGEVRRKQVAYEKTAGQLTMGEAVIWSRPEQARTSRNKDKSPSFERDAQPTGSAYEPMLHVASSVEQDRRSADVPPVPPPLPLTPVRTPGGESTKTDMGGWYAEAPALSVAGERHLGKRELMRIAKEIKIDGISLKDIYEVGRLDEEGLRAVVDSYLRGDDVRQRLTNELVTREQGFERDPRLRHTNAAEVHEQNRSVAVQEGAPQVQGLSGERGSMPSTDPNVYRGVGNGVGSVSNEGGSKAGEDGRLAGVMRQAVKSVARTLVRGAKIVQHDLIDNSNTTDWISVTAVVVLWSIILILLLG